MKVAVGVQNRQNYHPMLAFDSWWGSRHSDMYLLHNGSGYDVVPLMDSRADSTAGGVSNSGPGVLSLTMIFQTAPDAAGSTPPA